MVSGGLSQDIARCAQVLSSFSSLLFSLSLSLSLARARALSLSLHLSRSLSISLDRHVATADTVTCGTDVPRD